MKIEDVPQDQVRSYNGGSKVCYAVDHSGKLVLTPTSGWKIEEEAMNIAWRSIWEELEQIRTAVIAGKASPLRFFMRLRQMDEQLLAGHVGIWAWRVRWHLRPAKRLSGKWLARYAECLDVPVAALQDASGMQEFLSGYRGPGAQAP